MRTMTLIGRLAIAGTVAAAALAGVPSALPAQPPTQIDSALKAA